MTTAPTPTPATAERLARALHRLMAPERRRTSSGAWVIVESKQVEAEIEADAALRAYTAEGGKL